MDYYADGTLSAEKAALARTGLAQWIDTRALVPADLAGRCTVAALQAALGHLDGAEVVSATINDSGTFLPPPAHWVPNLAPDPGPITGLPPFCEIAIDQATPGGHIARTLVWVPLAWNGRLLATGGMGSITGPLWFDQPTIRTITMPIALRNGFATCATDAGNRDPRFFEWPLDPATGALDWELLRNWAYRSTHDMAAAARAIVQALHGAPPAWSYYAGCSGGGRQGLAAILAHPGDFDGVWASDPALNWTALWPCALWPALVMKELGNPLSEARLEAFRQGALEACDGADGLRDGMIGLAEMRDFDPASLIGRETADGPLTALDAAVMARIWDGPRRANGERMGFGLPIGTSGGGMVGIWKTAMVDGRLVPVANEGQAWFRWVTEDPAFDWTTLDFAGFEALADLGAARFREFACNDPDLTAFRDRGGKLLLSQAVNDPVIPQGLAVDYYRNVVEACGGLERTQGFARLFLTDGDIHGSIAGQGPGLTAASAMTALMRWTEQGEAPGEIVADRVDMASGAIAATRPVYPYPAMTRYSGSGDPALAASYERTLEPVA